MLLLVCEQKRFESPAERLARTRLGFSLHTVQKAHDSLCICVTSLCVQLFSMGNSLAFIQTIPILYGVTFLEVSKMVYKILLAGIELPKLPKLY